MRNLKRLFPFLLSTFLFSFSFPESHTFHRDFGIEWCYFVGTLEAEGGAKFGYELSFFRAKWKNAEVFPVHFALTDLNSKKHYTFQTLQRNQGGLAGYTPKKIWSGEYSFEVLSNEHFRITATPLHRKESLVLELKTTTSPLLHGKNGKSIKSRKNPDIFSYYYSLPRLESKGLLVDGQGKSNSVTGISWMDHEWSSPLSKEGQSLNSGFRLGAKDSAWDWVFLHLSDGSDLVAFQFRNEAKSESEAFGTFRDPKGVVQDFSDPGEVTFQAIGKRWKSPHSNKEYPLHWTINLPGIKLDVSPLFMEQEFDGQKSTGLVYWEGVVYAQGLRKGEPISGEGFLELKGR